MGKRVEIEYSDGEKVEVEYPDQEEIDELRDFHDEMMKKFYPDGFGDLSI